jgi:hypothetical protein
MKEDNMHQHGLLFKKKTRTKKREKENFLKIIRTADCCEAMERIAA